MSSGLKKRGVLDLGLIATDGPVKGAAVFTQSHAAAAPVLLCRERMAGGKFRAIVVNSGNANACTGRVGERHAAAMARTVARVLDVADEEVLVASTGVIGAPLPVRKIQAATGPLVAALRPEGAGDFARAILTTDRAEKLVFARGRVGGRSVRVVGVAKGAGMIMPDMATMLAFVCTDAAVPLPQLRRLTRRCVDLTFNAITVDGDTSTNDAVFVLASGLAGNASDPDALARLLLRVMEPLAKAIVGDGEGATHVFEVRVTGARSRRDADRVARRVANSPLVKTAVHGEDPNWGRIVGAIATAQVEVDPDRISVGIGPVMIYRRGRWTGPAAERKARLVMQKPEYPVTIDLGQGRATRTIWGCDLSADYVRINAGYRS